MPDITLSKAVRSNLLNLQSTAELLGRTQQRLSTGLRVNSALDSPTNFFTASSLNSRASDLNQLLDSTSNAVQTIAAADKGVSAITKLVESAQATARSALQTTTSAGATVETSNLTNTTIRTAGPAMAFGIDIPDDSVEGLTYLTPGETLSFTNAAGTATWTFTTVAGSGSAPLPWDITEGFQLQQCLSDISGYMDLGGAGAEDFAGTNFSISAASGRLVVSLGSDTTSTLTIGGTAAAALGLAGTYGPVTSGQATAGDITINGQTVSLANGDGAAQILTKLQAAAGSSSGDQAFTVSNSGGVLTIAGANGNAVDIGGDAETLAAVGLTAGTIAGSGSKRAELVDQYNSILNQIDQLASDAGFNGINLLNGDNLSVLFNEDGTSKLDIDGKSFDSTGLGLSELATTAFDDNDDINGTLDALKAAIEDLRLGASQLGSNLSVVETRQTFTKSLVNVLETGASNLTLADTSAEAASLLALQTRQQLSTTALSLASQADQNVLRLF